MWKKLCRHNATLSVLAGSMVVLAFPPIEWLPLVLLFPVLFTWLARRMKSFREGFLFGFLTSLVIMAGGFYWVVYVIHEFGHLPWSVSVLLYLGFCGFGALNFPLFLGIVGWANGRWGPDYREPSVRLLWYVLALPALFTAVEFVVPKLFPWYVGHSLYRALWLNQIVEITGSSFLTFLIFSLGTGALLVHETRRPLPLLVPGLLFLLSVAFSAARLGAPEPDGRRLRVGLVQANIGSLEKVQARHNVTAMVEHVVSRYTDLSNQALAGSPPPDLLLWPETAMPFLMGGMNGWARGLYAQVAGWGTPLITGGYAENPEHPGRDYNAAFLLEPQPDSTVETQVYRKNILLAFGEYLPGGDTWPVLYRKFPQVSNFMRGTEQKPFVLADGTRLGVTICYEAIVPTYYRKVAREGVHAVVNLTNDSWFGPTSEPHQHGALSVFRAIEFRLPLFRVTNTGTSFSVDAKGRLSRRTRVYGEDWLVSELPLPKEPPRTIYLRFGDWFISVCGVILALMAFRLARRNHDPVPA